MASQLLQPILALLGHPVAGNPLQYVTEKAFVHHGLDWRYVSFEVRPEDLADATRGLKVLGFQGGNCAAPHKETIGPLLDRLGRTAELVGAVNVIRRENDELIGENTEGAALVEVLRERFDPAGLRVALLGAGRMARAVAVELASAGVSQITVVDRDATRAAQLAELVHDSPRITASAVTWEGDYRVAPETDLLIHATTAMQGDPEAQIALDIATLESRMTVVDTTVDPPGTWLIDEARRRGCGVIDGVEIFVRQACVNFRIWTGVGPDASLLRESIEEYLGL